MSTPKPNTSRTPLVSICVPTYNGAEFLKPCLDSLLEQNLQDFELLIADDLSSDATLEIVRGYRDPRLTLLPFDTRAGMAANWNRCMAQARGEYVALVAQDDLVKPIWGERLVGLLEAHPAAGLAFGRREFELSDPEARQVAGGFFESSYPAKLAAFYERIETVVPPDVMLREAMRHSFEVNILSEPSFTMMRRDHPATRAGYRDDIRQMLDWEFASRFFVDQPILHCAEILGTYRIHAAGASVGHAPMTLQFQDYSRFLAILLERFRAQLTSEQREQLLAHREKLVSKLVVHTKTIEAERDSLLAHTQTLETEREHLTGHVRNLEKILHKTRALPIYRMLCKIKGVFGG